MRSLAALLVGVLLVVSVVAGIGAGHPGDDPAQSPSALPNPAAEHADALFDAPTEFADGPTVASNEIAPSDITTDSSDLSVPLFDLSVPPSETRGTVNSSANASSANGTSTDGTSANVTARDGTEMYVTVRENGDARWNVTAQFVLRDANETAAFRQLARDYEDGATDVGITRATFQPMLERASTDTDRQMELRNVGRSSSLRENGSVGTLSLSFTWTNFTTVEENRILLGDVFWVGSETWLPGLTADQSLTVEGPPGYYVDSSGVPISGGTRIHFEGPRTFESDDFSVTYAPKRTVTTTTTTTSTTTTGDGFLGFSGTSGVLALVVVLGIGFGAYAVAQRRGPDPDVPEASGTDAPPSAAPRDDGSDGGPSDAVDDPDEESEDGPPPELLSDEERVLRLLRDNDGRMKQADIVKETNWSNAKVSQLLSKMNDDDEVNKLRIGRENLITLPDEDVTDFD